MRRNEYDAPGPGQYNQSTPHKPISNSVSGVPFRDAIDGTNEIPLDQLDCFVVSAQDQNHVSEPVSFRIPPYLKRYCKIIVASGRFPYLDIEDLIRHAITRHVDWLCQIRETLPQHIRPAMHQQVEVCADDELRTQVEQVFNRAEERVKYHMARGDSAEVIRLLNLMKSRMYGVQQSSRMREFTERFDKLYGPYLRASQPTTMIGALAHAVVDEVLEEDELEMEPEENIQ